MFINNYFKLMHCPAGSPLWFIYYLKHKQILLQMSKKETRMSQSETIKQQVVPSVWRGKHKKMERPKGCANCMVSLENDEFQSVLRGKKHRKDIIFPQN